MKLEVLAPADLLRRRLACVQYPSPEAASVARALCDTATNVGIDGTTGLVRAEAIPLMLATDLPAQVIMAAVDQLRDARFLALYDDDMSRPYIEYVMHIYALPVVDASKEQKALERLNDASKETLNDHHH
jgi:hypothetical protein